MAKSAKKAKPKPKPSFNPGKPQEGTGSPAAPQTQPVIVTISFTFSGGIGQATAILFRRGIMINMQTISSSGNIIFSEVQSSDSIAVNGVCTGKAVIAVDTPTIPVTPQNFNAGLIMTGYLIK